MLNRVNTVEYNFLKLTGEIMLKYKGDHSYLYNVKTGTVPVVVHGNGPIKVGVTVLQNFR